MFTGLVQALATVQAVVDRPPGRLLTIHWPWQAAEVGESVAVNGCCLTLTDVTNELVQFEVGPETLARTNLADVREGDRVNLERSLRMVDALGGHFVTGHVDGVGLVRECHRDGDWVRVRFGVPGSLTGCIAPQGCIAVDGVSLTIVDAASDEFSVMLIPHTRSATTLGSIRSGSRVNLETDILAKYVQSALAVHRADAGSRRDA